LSGAGDVSVIAQVIAGAGGGSDEWATPIANDNDSNNPKTMNPPNAIRNIIPDLSVFDNLANIARTFPRFGLLP
jgi:hypothetical protein